MLNIQEIATDSLTPYARNPRKNEKAVDQVAASLKEYGWKQPIVIDRDKTIIAGHTRHLAAQKLGHETVPCLIADDLSDAQAKAYRLADNRTAQDAQWDFDLLSLELSELPDDLFTGFSQHEIDDLLREHRTGLTDEDETPEPPEEPRAKTGDVWLLGPHRLVCGDATDESTVTACLSGVKPHLMVTDPPYGVEYDATWRGKAGHATLGKNRTGVVANDCQADWREAWILFPGSIAYVWHGGLMAGIVADSLIACDFQLRSQIIWNKTVMAMGRGDYHWKHEPCWYAVRGTGQWRGDRKQTTVWDFPSPLHIMSGSNEEKTPHPTQKPVECMRRPIENNSSQGQAVYDPFVGSGTTIIAAETTGRVCHAIELNPAYVDVCIQRWQDFTGEKAIHEETGEAF